MTGPVWDGEGDDPWLPARLNALLDVEAAEQLMYATVWARYSAWLVATARQVLRGSSPDPGEVFAQVPAWQLAVREIIAEAVIPIMDRAYTAIFGPGYDWRDRPSVISYLAGVRDRLVRTPDEVFDLVAGQVAAGVTLGEDVTDLTARVDSVLSLTDSERWPNRAVVIARTEALGALNGSRQDAFVALAEEGGEELERMWLSTVDHRTRASHREADGQRTGLSDPFMVGGFALMFPGDPAGPPGEVIQCRCTTLLVERGEVIDLSDRQFTSTRR